MAWKKGRGKLGIFKPLLGTWIAEADSPQGTITVTRTFEKVLGGKYIRLRAVWKAEELDYEEIAMIGVDANKEIHFWSFTSDGKQSEGILADASDLHPQAICFVAEMPAGTARTAYWPMDDDAEGFQWVVESKTKKGWNRFVRHLYEPALA